MTEPQPETQEKQKQPLMIFQNGEVDSSSLIYSIKAAIQGDKLAVTAQTQTAFYHGEISKEQTRRTFEQLKNALEKILCYDVAENFNTLSFLCEDVQFKLQNRDVQTIFTLNEQITELEQHTRELWRQIVLKQENLLQKITLRDQLQKQIQQSQNIFNVRKQIDKTKTIRSLSQQRLIQLLQNVKIPLFGLQLIDLSWSKISDRGVEALGLNGRKCPNLKYLDLSDNLITDRGLRFIAENANKFPLLSELRLSNNYLTDDGLSLLAQNSAKFSRLQKLYLSDNRISDQGFNSLAEGADKLVRLKELHLSTNLITDKGVKCFVANGINFTNLEIIHLSDNKITNEGMRSITRNLKATPNLRQIYLDKSKITKEEKAKNEQRLKIGCYIFPKQ